MQALDRSAGFVPHKELRAAIERREETRAQRGLELDPGGYEWRARWRLWRKFWRAIRCATCSTRSDGAPRARVEEGGGWCGWGAIRRRRW